MSYSRLRSVPGALYGVGNSTLVYPPNSVFQSELLINSNSQQELQSDDVVLCVGSDVPNKSPSWSLVMYNDGSAPKLGWVYNDQLRWIPGVTYS